MNQVKQIMKISNYHHSLNKIIKFNLILIKDKKLKLYVKLLSNMKNHNKFKINHLLLNLQKIVMKILLCNKMMINNYKNLFYNHNKKKKK